MSQPGGPADMPEEVWDAQMDVNLKSVYLMCHHTLPSKCLARLSKKEL